MPQYWMLMNEFHIIKNNFWWLQVHEIVSGGPGIALTKALRKKHAQKAMDVLQVFQESDARTALSNIIIAMGEL